MASLRKATFPVPTLLHRIRNRQSWQLFKVAFLVCSAVRLRTSDDSFAKGIAYAWEIVAMSSSGVWTRENSTAKPLSR